MFAFSPPPRSTTDLACERVLCTLFNYELRIRWYHYKTGQKLGIEFDYPYPQNDDELRIGMDDLEDMNPQVRSMLFQSLKMNSPEFGLAYS